MERHGHFQSSAVGWLRAPGTALRHAEHPLLRIPILFGTALGLALGPTRFTLAIRENLQAPPSSLNATLFLAAMVGGVALLIVLFSTVVGFFIGEPIADSDGKTKDYMVFAKPRSAAQMNRPAIRSVIIVGIALSASAWSKPAGDPDAVLDRIDKAGFVFRGMSANVRQLSHTAVINEDNRDSGTILLKRAHPRDLRMLIDLREPDPKTVVFQGRKLEIYDPKMATVQEFDVGKERALLEQFCLLGFGTSLADLKASYNLRLVGPDKVDGRKTDLLELIPKSKAVLQQLTKLEMWVAENGYPIQHKLYLKGGDYQLATYSDMKVNLHLPDSALRLKLPKNVKRVYAQK